jgi:hypothetical protein
MNVKFGKFTELQKELPYKKLHIENIDFCNRSSEWLLNACTQAETLQLKDCHFDIYNHCEHIGRMTKLTDLGMQPLSNSL